MKTNEKLTRLLEELYLLNNGNTKLKNYLKQLGYYPITLENLKNAYDVLTVQLAQSNKEKNLETTKTFHEVKAQELIEKNFKLKFYTSFWIGNFNLDFFFPQLRMAIEIDGDIHNQQAKMKKDGYKEYVLSQKFKIVILRIKNDEILTKLIPMLKEIKSDSSYLLSSKAKKRLLRDIYIFTIVTLANNQAELAPFIPHLSDCSQEEIG